MGFIKKLFGGTAEEPPQIEPSPTQEEFDVAEHRLKDAVDASPHKASSDITAMATSLYELYSKRGDYLKATGDVQGFILNTALSMGPYEMAAQSNYHTGWIVRAIEVLEAGLSYANDALSLAPLSIHVAIINGRKQHMEMLLNLYALELREAQQGVIKICEDLLRAGVNFSSNSDPIWKLHGLKTYILALSEAVASVVFSIIEPGVFGPYKDIWKQDESVFWELASFLGYYFFSYSIRENSVVNSQGDTLSSVVASIWPPTDRVHAMIDRFSDLMNDPQEMKDRRILWATFPGDTDESARGVVYEYIVNELLHGPNLGGAFDGLECIDPYDGVFLRSYSARTVLEKIKVLKDHAARL